MPYPLCRAKRQSRGWSQKTVGELVKHCGLNRALTQNEVSLIERGRLNPTREELAALATLFGVQPPERLLEPAELDAEVTA